MPVRDSTNGGREPAVYFGLMSWGAFHALVDGLDRSLPKGWKSAVKRRFPAVVDGVYAFLAKGTPRTPRQCVIQTGPLAGRQFFCSLKYERSYFLGNYEPEVVEWLSASLKPGDTMLDVGGHFGYTALVCAQLVGQTGCVVTFEPSENNRYWLQKNLEVNRDLAGRVKLESLALSDVAGVAEFHTHPGSTVGKLAAGGTTRVVTTTLDEYVKSNRLQPALIKMDIEGGETRAFDGMSDTLHGCRPVVIVELHDPEAHARCLAVIREFGYTSTPTLADTWGDRVQVCLVPK